MKSSTVRQSQHFTMHYKDSLGCALILVGLVLSVATPVPSDLDLCKPYRERNPNVQQKTLNQLYWLHVPKCGTSFGLTLMNFGCPRLPNEVDFPKEANSDPRLPILPLMADLTKRYKLSIYCDPNTFDRSRPLAFHMPVPPQLYNSQRGVALLRDPRKRDFSAFHSKHADGMKKQLKPSLKRVETLGDYMAFPGIRSCQVKMMTGRYCAEYSLVTNQDLENAKKHLSTALAFVGLTDYFNESVCLFHAMFGGNPRESSFSHARPTSQFSSGYESSEAPFVDDPFDEALYMEARKIFVSRLKQYGFKVPYPLLLEENPYWGYRNYAIVVGILMLLCLVVFRKKIIGRGVFKN
eukprot:m.67520 g.67520  ORF g.67520 m.67520 type:complete len:351 (+) comp11897_c0_seq1:122-1174(+)